MREDEFPVPHVLQADQWGPGYGLWSRLLGLLAQRGPDGTTTVVRIASHLLILVVAIAVIAISRMQLPSWEITSVEGVPADLEAAEVALEPPRSETNGVDALVRSAVPQTLIAEPARTNSVYTYTVQAGDTLWGIAAKLNVAAETLIWANGMEENPDLLRLGQDLTVLPVDGVLHKVAQGDTVESIAKKYKAKPEDILGFAGNGIDPNNPGLAVGARVIVPGGAKAMPAARQAATAATKNQPPKVRGHFIWPTSGSITQSFWNYHRAIDIAAWTGVPIKAADGGTVAQAGWSNQGYGNMVLVNHGNGFVTRYAHLSKILVRRGSTVQQGTLIGRMGSTGRSTGPHLHFEVIYGGVARNPFNYLP